MMTFPVPEHLPRAVVPDISTRILSKIASTSSKTLTAELASSWISDLDETIIQTKARIHERTYADLPAFEGQLAASYSVQERLHTLAHNIDSLSDSVANPETGLIHPLLAALSSHAVLAQNAQDASVLYSAARHLSQCRQHLDSLESLAREGKLAAAADAARRLEAEFERAPYAVNLSDTLSHLKSDFRTVKDRVQEQLSEAYSRAVSLAPGRFVIRPVVQIRQSSMNITLPSILASSTSESLSNYLSALKRDIVTHFIDQILTHPLALKQTVTDDEENALEASLFLTPQPLDNSTLGVRLDSVTGVLNFLERFLFPALPLSSASSFKQSLCKPLTNSLLNKFLVPALPSAFLSLPLYLDVIRRTTELEERYIIGVLGQDARDRSINAWVERVSVHYERKRSTSLLELARTLILREDDGGKIPVETEVEPSVTSPRTAQSTKLSPPLAPASASGHPATSLPAPEPILAERTEDRWGLDEEPEGDGWGLDDDELPEREHEPETHPTSSASSQLKATNGSHSNGSMNGDRDDFGDAWGWNDDDDLANDLSTPTSDSASVTDDSSAWDDDPWGDGDSSVSVPGPEATLAPPAPTHEHKPATRVEKLASKSKAKHTPPSSPESTARHPPPQTLSSSAVPPHSSARKVTASAGPMILASPFPREKETFIVTRRVQELISAVENALHESNDFASTTLFGPIDDQRGTTIMQAATGMLDLFRALYPIKFADALAQSAEEPILFANECAYLSTWTRRQGKPGSKAAGKLKDAGQALGQLSESWFDLAIDAQEQVINDALADLEGLTDTSSQDRFDECEAAITRVLSQIRDVARRWKNILTKTKYFDGVGALVDTALSRMLDDILALSDITEIESHRLSELCRIFGALEGLFLDNSGSSSLVVAYVPSWLKFSYLSELLEASLTDVAYLFDEGALVDFEVGELIQLVKALFAETPQRANLIQKIAIGHPERT